MIKIDKDLNDIPVSLCSEKAHNIRKKLIASGGYDALYDKDYKKKDVQNSLAKIYNNKCAYCEWRIEEFHVEHFRPKSIYYWLALSWDNLLLACSKCNRAKTNDFPFAGTAQIFTPKNIYDNQRLIHTLADSLDRTELPLLVNPEKEDPQGHIQFLNDGTIASDDTRYVCTIEICRLNRPSLVTERKLILDELARKIRAEIGSTKDSSRQRDRLGTCVRNYREENRTPSTPFLGFRRFAMRHLLRSLIKGIFPRDGGAA